jgi:glycosyltransferase involved in cell wall biosynthesis
MDFVANSLHQQFKDQHSDKLRAVKIAPDIRRIVSRRPDRTSSRFNADRVLHRFWNYPRQLRSLTNSFDLYHIIDHSYSQLALELPGSSTIITCHDLDAFRCLLEPTRTTSVARRAMSKRILAGFRSVTRVICVSAHTRQELLKYRLIPEERTIVIPNGIDAVCQPQKDEAADLAVRDLLGPPSPIGVDILNVGSTVPRKRISFLLELMAAIRGSLSVRLIRVGGQFTAEQENLVRSLGLSGCVVVLPFLTARTLAAVYRRCALAVQTSEREGFGLPIAEAMACGTPVVASDISIFREIGGNAVEFCQTYDLGDWTETLRRVLEERRLNPAAWARRKANGLVQAHSFSWAENARKTLDVYNQLRPVPSTVQ